MEPVLHEKVTVIKFIVQVLLSIFFFGMGSAGLTSGDVGYAIFGLAFVLLSVLCIINVFVRAYRQWTGEEKTYDE